MLSSSIVLGDQDDMPLSSAAEMALWCKELSYVHLLADADRIYNWSHSVIAKGNSYLVKGKWRVEGEDVGVECRSRIGAPRRYATLTIKGVKRN